MATKKQWRNLRACLALCVLTGMTLYACAQAVVETSSETRFQLDLHVPDAALKALLPPGFTSCVAPQGPAKDANLRVVFIDRITVMTGWEATGNRFQPTYRSCSASEGCHRCGIATRARRSGR